MNISGNLKFAGIAALLIAGLAACDKPAPAATAGAKIDQSVDEAGKQAGEAAHKIGEKLGEKATKSGIAIDDAEITAKIKEAIFAEPGLRTLQINVATLYGVVTLSGSVDSLPSRDRAEALAGAVAGVNRVTNHLVPR